MSRPISHFTQPAHPSGSLDGKVIEGFRQILPQSSDIRPFVDLSATPGEEDRRSLLELWREAERAALIAGEWGPTICLN